MEKIPLIVVAGPTASGKTSLAIEIAKRLDGEIVSADSMQIYKYMDIGTAKPTKEEREAVPHHLIDFAEPGENFSVADYTPMAHRVIKDIYTRGKTPVLTGGTGLYIDSVVDDISFKEVMTDYKMREELARLAEEKGGEYLIEMLREFDPVSAETLHPNNLRRVIRAIEFYKTTGMPISEHKKMTKLVKSRYNACMLAIEWDREKLYERINKRVDIMLEEGLLDEVKRLADMGYKRSINAMQGIGYKEIIAYLEGEYSFERAVELIKQGSRRYAKRQLTWFRRNERIHWIDSDKDILKEAMKIIENERQTAK